MRFYYRGRVALAAIFRALGIGANSRVLIQAFTCLAVPEAVLAVGAEPVYVDIEAQGFNIDPDAMRRAIGPGVKAVVVQHTYGIPAQLEKIAAIAEERGIAVIEDCCHLIPGAERSESSIAAFYSFEWGKPVVAGIGGAATSRNAAVNERLKAAHREYSEPASTRVWRIEAQYLAHRILYRPWLFWPVRSIYRRLGNSGVAEQNYHPVDSAVSPEFNWTMPARLRQRAERGMQHASAIADHADRTSRAYRAQIIAAPVIHPSLVPTGKSFCRYPLRVTDKPSVLRAAQAQNVELADWYSTPIHPLPQREWSSVGYTPGACPNAEQRCSEVVTLPTHRAVRQRDIDRAAAFLNRL